MSSMFTTKDGIPMKFMTIKEFCECLNISRATYRRLEIKPKMVSMGAGKLKHIRDGNATRISREAAIEWVKLMEEKS